MASTRELYQPPPTHTMLPSPDLLPAVLPTDRLGLKGVTRPDLRAEYRQIPDGRNAVTVVSALLQTVGVAIAAALAWGRPLLYPVCWLAPWMSLWKVSNRLRAIAEHGGMARSDDRRLTTHHVRQRLLARFLIVPYNTGWHLAHHVDIAVPFRN